MINKYLKLIDDNDYKLMETSIHFLIVKVLHRNFIRISKLSNNSMSR